MRTMNFAQRGSSISEKERTDRYARVLTLRLQGHTLKETGDALGISVETARQVEAKALRRLRGLPSYERGFGQVLYWIANSADDLEAVKTAARDVLSKAGWTL